MYNNKNTATETMVNDYLVVHVRGEDVFKNHTETGLHPSRSCVSSRQLLVFLRASTQQSAVFVEYCDCHQSTRLTMFAWRLTLLLHDPLVS